MSNFGRILKGYHFVLLFTFMCPFAGYAQAASQAAMEPQAPPTSWVDPQGLGKTLNKLQVVKATKSSTDYMAGLRNQKVENRAKR